MGAIIDFLTGLADIVVGLVDFVIGFIGDIVYLVQLTAKAVANAPNYFNWLSPDVVSLIIGILAVVVIYKILGREG